MQIVEKSVGKVIASIPLILASIGAWASEFRYRAERIFNLDAGAI